MAFVEWAVPINPGDDWATVIAANPVGTTFRIMAGAHVSQSITPKAHTRYIGRRGAVMDGNKVTLWAFRTVSGGTTGSIASHVEISGLTILRYKPLVQYGAILCGDTQTSQSSRWIITGCSVYSNLTGAGIRLGDSSLVLNNSFMSNGQIGLVGIANDSIISGNEIAYNNSENYSQGNEAGGIKVVSTTTNVQIRGNNSHHNKGNGIWTDGDITHAVIENNTCEDNEAQGIFHEVSWLATIRNNEVHRNGLVGYDWYYGAGILISASSGVSCYNNNLSGNARGIICMMQDRGISPLSGTAWSLENNKVYDNTISMLSRLQDGSSHGNCTGLANDTADLSYYSTKGNTFEHNSYSLGTYTNYFTWSNVEITKSAWTTISNDETGSFS